MDYIQDSIRSKIIQEILNFEVPKEWNSEQTISFIVNKLDKSGQFSRKKEVKREVW